MLLLRSLERILVNFTLLLVNLERILVNFMLLLVSLAKRYGSNRGHAMLFVRCLEAINKKETPLLKSEASYI
ncbi:hypothetical protein ACFQ9Y_01995 [Peribacillus simplex]|uniref:hypothetical protein n=1 Tax=Peribacillus simplex TaxID=1478 RepID=UPI00366D3C78